MQSTARISVAAVALLSIAAFGQDSTTTTTETQTQTTTGVDGDPVDGFTTEATTTTTTVDNRPRLITPIGLGLSVGGGVHDFFDDGLKGLTGTGGSWEARLIAGTRTYLGGELAYVGTANPISNGLGVSDSAVLVSNGFEGLVRVNAMVDAWQPYGVVGYAYRRYTVQNTLVNVSAISDGDNDHQIPFGVGLSYRFRGLIADGRFMVHPSVSSDLVTNTDTLPIALSVAAKVGFEF